MGGNYTREDFNDEMNDLELGLEKEQECLTFYSDSAEQVADPGVRGLYQWFSGAAEARISALKSFHAVATDTISWAPDLEEQMKSAEVQIGSAPAFEVGGAPGQAEIMTLRQAIELEKEAASIYHTAVRRSRDTNVRALWRYLAGAEEAHKALLDTYFDGLMQTVMKKKKKAR